MFLVLNYKLAGGFGKGTSVCNVLYSNEYLTQQQYLMSSICAYGLSFVPPSSAVI